MSLLWFSCGFILTSHIPQTQTPLQHISPPEGTIETHWWERPLHSKSLYFLQMKTKVSTLVPEEMVQFYKIFCNIYVGLRKTWKHGEFSTSQMHVKISAPAHSQFIRTKARLPFVLPWHCRATNTPRLGFSKQHKGVKHLDLTEFHWMLDMGAF